MDKNGRIVYYSHVCNIVYVMTSNAYKTMHVIASLKKTSISLKSDFYVSLDNFFFFFTLLFQSYTTRFPIYTFSRF